MGILGKFEQGVERVVNGAFTARSKGGLEVVDLSAQLRKELDQRVAKLNRDRTVAPNEFTIELSTSDFDQIEAWGANALADELANDLTEYAAKQHYAFVGPVLVGFTENLDLPAGKFEIHSAIERGAVAPATNPEADRHPLIDIDGQRYLLTGQLTVIGRDPQADIVVDDPGVSRRHMQIRVTPDGVIAEDLGSTNGMYVEGHKVPAATLLDGNTLSIGRTQIMYWSGTETSDD